MLKIFEIENMVKKFSNNGWKSVKGAVNLAVINLPWNSRNWQNKEMI